MPVGRASAGTSGRVLAVAPWQCCQWQLDVHSRPIGCAHACRMRRQASSPGDAAARASERTIVMQSACLLRASEQWRSYRRRRPLRNIMPLDTTNDSNRKKCARSLKFRIPLSRACCSTRLRGPLGEGWSYACAATRTCKEVSPVGPLWRWMPLCVSSCAPTKLN